MISRRPFKKSIQILSWWHQFIQHFFLLHIHHVSVTIVIKIRKAVPKILHDQEKFSEQWVCDREWQRCDRNEESNSLEVTLELEYW